MLNLLSSIDGTNYPSNGTSWDISELHPSFSLAVPASDIDYDSFVRFRQRLGERIVASYLILGSAHPTTFEDVFYRLLAPWGGTVGQRLDGKWACLYIGNTYDGDSVAAITSVQNWDRMKQITVGRSLDEVVIECDTRPDGTSTYPVIIDAPEGRDYTPEPIGQQRVYRSTPYSSRDFLVAGEGTLRHAGRLVSTRLRRLSRRLDIVEDVGIGPNEFGTIDVGDHITIHSSHLRNPATGLKLAASDDPLNGIVTHVYDVNLRARTCNLRIALTGQDRVARIAPGVKVSSWDSMTLTATTYSHQFTRTRDGDGNSLDDDAEHFEVGDTVILLNSKLNPASDPAQDPAVTVASVGGATSITFDRAFLTTVPATVNPVDGQFIVLRSYGDDYTTTARRNRYAFMADGGADGSASSVGGSTDVYVFGD